MKSAGHTLFGALERAALRYLERYGGSAERVRRFLVRRVKRAALELGTDPEEGAHSIENVLAKLVRLGYLDDARFATAKVRAMRRRGKSARDVRAALASHGVSAELVDRALEGEPEAELEAARAFVRRRRLGPHRSAEQRELERERDLGRLARAGFSYAVAVCALAGDPTLE